MKPWKWPKNWLSVMLKASAGGGGRVFRKVEKPEDLVAAFESLLVKPKRGNGAMYGAGYLSSAPY